MYSCPHFAHFASLARTPVHRCNSAMRHVFGVPTMNFQSVTTNLARHLSSAAEYTSGGDNRHRSSTVDDRAEVGAHRPRSDPLRDLQSRVNAPHRSREERNRIVRDQHERVVNRRRQRLDSSSSDEDDDDSSGGALSAAGGGVSSAGNTSSASLAAQIKTESQHVKTEPQRVKTEPRVKTELPTSAAWACRVCTFINRSNDGGTETPPSLAQCEMCGAPKPIGGTTTANMTAVTSTAPTANVSTTAKVTTPNMTTAAPAEPKECVVCLERPVDTALVHGGTAHAFFCFQCATEMKRRKQKCPICRQKIQAVVKVFS